MTRQGILSSSYTAFFFLCFLKINTHNFLAIPSHYFSNLISNITCLNLDKRNPCFYHSCDVLVYSSAFQADVIVANPYLKYGDDPYTLQYGQCGEKGQYIHFTPNFLLTNNLPIYGSRGRDIYFIISFLFPLETNMTL